MNVDNICNICYEHDVTYNINYICDSKCFVNNKNNLIICDKCIFNWIKKNSKNVNNNKIYKCLICSKFTFKIINDIESFNQETKIININEEELELLNIQEIETPNNCCILNIECNFISCLKYYFYRYIHNHKVFLSIITYLLFVSIVGFLISSLWMFLFDYDLDTTKFKEKVINKDWSNPLYYFGLCPLYGNIFFIIILLVLMCFKCLDNICC